MASIGKFLLSLLLLLFYLCLGRCEHNGASIDKVEVISEDSNLFQEECLPRLPEDIFHDLPFLDSIAGKELTEAQKRRIINSDMGVFFPRGFVNSNKENNILCKSASETLHLFSVGTIPLEINCDVIVIFAEKEGESGRWFYLITQKEGTIIGAELMALTDDSDGYGYYIFSKKVKSNNYIIYRQSNQVIKNDYNLLTQVSQVI